MLDEQSQNAYLNLINALLTCPNGQEAEILKSNQELIDTGLLQTMEQVAAMLVGQGNQNAANWLRNVAAQLAKVIANSSVVTTDEHQNFLLQVLQAMEESKGNPQLIYPLLQANLNKLDDNFAKILQDWATANILGALSLQVVGRVRSLAYLSKLIQEFPLGSKAINLEIAIIGYEVVLTFFTRLQLLESCVEIQNNLGAAYSDRIRGNRAENLEKAIQYYQATLQVYTREASPEDWAGTQYNLSIAYRERICGDRAENLEQALYYCQTALQVYTRQVFPERWAMTLNNLGIAYNDRIRGDRAENIEAAICCYQKALQVGTHQEFPQHWADIQTNVGNAYINRINGDWGQNLEQAITCYQVALQVRTREACPQDWADIQTNLATAYYKRIRGKRAENFEQAITCYQSALQIRTREAFPQQWAAIQNNLGVAYSDRIRGERAENLEQTIQCYEAALQVHTLEAYPQRWAETQNNLGTAYSDRIRGERTQNLELAITAFQAALQVYTYEVFPEQWAMTQNNLGVAYRERICGERAENLELALRCHQATLKVRTRETLPQQWADTQHKLGIVYSNRIRGDCAENLEQAIQCYQAALEVRTREACPQDWAMTQNSLGNAYSSRVRGDRAENLEQAIQCYQAALEVRTREACPQDWAMTQNSLGNAYSSRVRGDRAENLEQAIQCYQAALEVRTHEASPEQWAMLQTNLGNAYCKSCYSDQVENSQQAIHYYQAALQVYTHEAFPEQWANIQNGLGLAYRKQGQTAEAIACFRSALKIHTSIANPAECLRTGKNFGDTALEAGQWSEAIEGYGVAIEAVEISRSWGSTDARRQEILKEAVIVYMNLVQACINNGQLDNAIEYIERSRSRHLADLMASNNLYQGGELSSEVQHYLQQYESLQQLIDQERFSNNSDNERELSRIGTRRSDRAALEAYNRTVKSLEAEKQQIWEQLRRLDPVLAGQVQVSASNLGRMQQLIDHRTTAILSFYTTRNDTHVFVVRQNQITCHSCLGQGLETLHDRLIADKWLRLYAASCDPTQTKQEQNQLKTAWINKFSPFLTELAQRLQVDRLIAQHLSGIEELILVPHLYLHQIPFAALPLGNSQYLGDKFLIRYIPSCQILEFCSNRPQLGSQLIYGVVEDATEDLPCASFEGEQIAQLYNIPDSLRLKGRSQATISHYRRLLQEQKVQALLSSHHAQSRLDNPLESKLYLGDGSITLGQLMTPGWRLPQLSDVFLSCCETGLGVTELTNFFKDNSGESLGQVGRDLGQGCITLDCGAGLVVRSYSYP